MHELNSIGMNNIELYFAKPIATTKLCSVPNSPNQQVQCCDQKYIHDMLQHYRNMNLKSHVSYTCIFCDMFMFVQEIQDKSLIVQ